MVFYNDNMKKLPDKILKDLKKRKGIVNKLLITQAELQNIDKQIDKFIEKVGK